MLFKSLVLLCLGVHCYANGLNESEEAEIQKKGETNRNRRWKPYSLSQEYKETEIQTMAGNSSYDDESNECEGAEIQKNDGDFRAYHHCGPCFNTGHPAMFKKLTQLSKHLKVHILADMPWIKDHYTFEQLAAMNNDERKDLLATAKNNVTTDAEKNKIEAEIEKNYGEFSRYYRCSYCINTAHPAMFKTLTELCMHARAHEMADMPWIKDNYTLEQLDAMNEDERKDLLVTAKNMEPEIQKSDGEFRSYHDCDSCSNTEHPATFKKLTQLKKHLMGHNLADMTLIMDNCKLEQLDAMNEDGKEDLLVTAKNEGTTDAEKKMESGN